MPSLIFTCIISSNLKVLQGDSPVIVLCYMIQVKHNSMKQQIQLLV